MHEFLFYFEKSILESTFVIYPLEKIVKKCTSISIGHNAY